MSIGVVNSQFTPQSKIYFGQTLQKNRKFLI